MTVSKRRKEAILSIFYLTLLYQRQNRFIARVYDSPVDIAEIHVMVELASRSEARTTELARIISLDKSTISRVVRRLENKSYVTRVPNHPRRLKLTSDGTELLSSLGKMQSGDVNKLMSSLSKGEQGKLKIYFKELADGSGAAPIVYRPHDHPIRQEIRRWTRSMGMLGYEFLGTGFSSPQIHILMSISQANGESPASELIDKLGANASTFSRNSGRLVDSGLLQKESSKTDKRAVVLKLTKKGHETINKIEAKAIYFFSSALSDLSLTELLEFKTIFSKFIGIKLPTDLEQTKLKSLKTEQDRQQGRDLLGSIIQQSEDQYSLPEILLGSKSINLGYFADGELLGVLEFTKQGQSLEISNYAVNDIDGEMEEEFLLGALNYVKTQHKTTSFSVPEASWAVYVLEQADLSSLGIKLDIGCGSTQSA